MSISKRIAEMTEPPKPVQAFDLEIESLQDHLQDALEQVDDELEDVLKNAGSSPRRLHQLRESIRSCQDIVSVILEYDQKLKAKVKTKAASTEENLL